MEAEDNWLPLESNPEVMNEFIKKLGMFVQLLRIQSVGIFCSGTFFSLIMGSINAYQTCSGCRIFILNQLKTNILL